MTGYSDIGYSERALLPEGFHDTLSPAAEYEAEVRARLLARFAAFGYDRVAPPIMEFEESLLSGAGGTQARRMFRVMDPTTQRMMGVRTDITIQVARIAATRLGAAARPLRLCYAGQVLRVKGGQLRTEREFGQAGIELIGSPSAEADVEVLLVASEALKSAGLTAVSIDLTLPALAPVLARELGLDDDTAAEIRSALNNKDIGRLDALDGEAGRLFRGLLAAAGPAENALAVLGALKLPDRARALVDDLGALMARLHEVASDQTFTIDPGEFRGFEYKTGVGFTLFADNVRGELGRGGRYEIERADGSTESATGFTVYIDSLLRALPTPPAAQKVYVPGDAPMAAVATLHDQGWRTVRGLETSGDDEADDNEAAARALGCTHIWSGAGVAPLD